MPSGCVLAVPIPWVPSHVGFNTRPASSSQPRPEPPPSPWVPGVFHRWAPQGLCSNLRLSWGGLPAPAGERAVLMPEGGVRARPADGARVQAPGCPALPSCSVFRKHKGAARCLGLCEEGRRLAGPPAARRACAVPGPAPLRSLPPLGSAFCQGSSAACPQLEQSLPSLPVFPTSRSCAFVLRSVCFLPPLLLLGWISALSRVQRGCRGAPLPPCRLPCCCFAVRLRPEASADGCWPSGICMSPAAETPVRLACGGWEPRRRAVLLQLVSVGTAPTPSQSRAAGPQSLHFERVLQ